MCGICVLNFVSKFKYVRYPESGVSNIKQCWFEDTKICKTEKQNAIFSCLYSWLKVPCIKLNNLTKKGLPKSVWENIQNVSTFGFLQVDVEVSDNALLWFEGMSTINCDKVNLLYGTKT